MWQGGLVNLWQGSTRAHADGLVPGARTRAEMTRPASMAGSAWHTEQESYLWQHVTARHQARKETPLCLRKYRPKTQGKAPHGSTGGYDQLVKPRVQDLPEGREPCLEKRGANHRLRQLNAQTQTYSLLSNSVLSLMARLKTLIRIALAWRSFAP